MLGFALVAASVFTLFAVSLLAPPIVRIAGRWSGWVLALAPLGWASWYASHLTMLGGSGAIEPAPIGWVDQIGVSLAFRVDGLGMLFALLVLGIGGLVVAYAGGYLKGHAQLGRFMSFLVAFMASMLGLVVVDNVLLIFIFWELTSITSYLLIGFDHEKEDSRKAALQALLVTGLGGLALLAGLVLLAIAAGTFNVSEMLASSDAITASPLFIPILVLVLLGAATKSAQFPFHFWLPSAMAAPAPVSAYLHSSTMVKAGVFLLAKLAPVLGGVPAWDVTLTLIGAVTTLYGGVLAIRSIQFKKVLAYTTVSALGTMVLLIGAASPGEGALAAFILAHAMYKGALFMAAGAVEKATGTKDVREVSGLWRRMPIVSAALVLAGLSMAGVPLFFGAAAKDLAKSSVHDAAYHHALELTLIASGALFATAALVVACGPVFGGQSERVSSAKRVAIGVIVGPVILAALGIVAGLLPAAFATQMVGGATHAVTSAAFESADKLNAAALVSLKWLLGPSAIGVAAGIVIYTLRKPLRAAATATDRVLLPVSPPALYDATVAGVLAFSRWQTRLLQSGSIGRYIRVTVIGGIVSVGWLVWQTGTWKRMEVPWDGLQPFEGVLIVIIIASAIAAAMVRKRLAAVAALGVVGIGVSLVFVLFGAPDVAMTQFAVETLTVLVFVLAFYNLPQFRRLTGGPMRIWEVGISAVFGIGMGSLLLISSGNELAPPISDYFSQNAVEEAYGRNIINVILVDFRATDTFGEILVLALSAIGITALLRQRGPQLGPAAESQHGGRL